MRGWYKGRIFLGIAFVSLILMTSGCSKDSPSGQSENVVIAERTPSSGEETGSMPPREPAAPIEENFEELSGPRDAGDPCREHRYQLLPGSVTTLRFEKRLGERPAGDEIRFEVERDHWAAIGINARIETTSLEGFTADLKLWTVDLQGSGLLFGADGDPVRKLSVTTPDARGVTGVKWLRDGVFTVAEINGRRWTERALSRLTEAEMRDLCDGELTFRYPDPENDRVDEFPVETVELSQEYYILTVTVEISLGDEFPTPFSGREFWYLSPEVGRITLRAAYSPLTGRHITISGPAFLPDCE